jgi:mono/diheme cytochrome c family protein
MKKLSLLLLTSLTLITLSACEADKITETTPAVATAATETNTAAAATVAETKANTPSSEATQTAAPSTSKAAVDEDSGEGIHQASCSRCHGTELYTRSDRKVTSLDRLGAQVRMCDSQLETQLFPEDMEKITTYLNESFYKF